MQPLLAVTMGDVNGVGPEILAKALCRPEIRDRARLVVFGDAETYEQVCVPYPGAPRVHRMNDITEMGAVPDEAIAFLDAGYPAPPRRPGDLSPEAGRCAVEWTKAAVHQALAGSVAGLVTCPLNKEGIHRAGYSYHGHTDLIAEMCGTERYRMCLFAESPSDGGAPMRIVHVSAHESLLKAVQMVTRERVADSIRLGHEALVQLGAPRRRIAVSGLNPHAGEAGAFGSEEITAIRPAIDACLAEGVDCSGPHPADTVFSRMHMGDFDLVVAMYHDQGHGPFKLVAMDDGVNVTLGLPVIRTSVDHGTAYDIAGTGRAREHSLCAAIELAAQMAAETATTREE